MLPLEIASSSSSNTKHGTNWILYIGFEVDDIKMENWQDKLVTGCAKLIFLFFLLFSLSFSSNFFAIFSFVYLFVCFLFLAAFSSGFFLCIIFVLLLFLLSESSDFWYNWLQIMTLNSNSEQMS